MGIYLCVCGSTSRVLGVWVIQFSVTLFRKISRDPTEQSSSESSLNFPDPTENRTSGSRFDAQPIVEASCAGPAPLDLGASLLGSWALSRPRSRPTPTPPGISDISCIISLFRISYILSMCLVCLFYHSIMVHGSWIIYSLPKKAPLPRPKSHSRAMVSLLSFMICLVRSFTEIIPIH